MHQTRNSCSITIKSAKPPKCTLYFLTTALLDHEEDRDYYNDARQMAHIPKYTYKQIEQKINISKY